MVHTPYGTQILETFLRDIAGCDMDWSAASVSRSRWPDPRPGRRRQGDLRALGRRGLAVAALLTYQAVGDQLTCVFVDHGLMRKNEGEQVVKAFRDVFKVPLVAVDAEERFLDRLAGVTSPRRSARSSARSSSACFEEEAARLGNPRSSFRAPSTRT